MCGSSPLARGILPATGYGCRAFAVHPRWRGEYDNRFTCSLRAGGSSPLARGILARSARPARARRFIPAGAGNTCSIWLMLCSETVHPRWRGEYIEPIFDADSSVGSSPLARGIHVIGDVHRQSRRFIPAGAGNTRDRRCSSPESSVHPRWRGEYPFSPRLILLNDGSSPLARGILQHLVDLSS